MADYTTNLNLLKKNPETDGNDYFNIQTMLNDNWDKIDSEVAAKETPMGAQAKVDELAGAGRTTQTVKGNADAIASLNQTVAAHSADNVKHITSVERTAWNGKIDKSLATAANDFLVASGVGVWVKKTLAEVKSILGLGSAAYTASTDYAMAGHNHNSAYSAITHNHSGVYEPVDANIMRKNVAQTMTANLVAKTGTDHTTKRVRNTVFKTGADFTTAELAEGDIGFIY